jgi:plasmid stabilization system protein ParE
VTAYRLLSIPEADSDLESAFLWYERERLGLGVEFIEEVRSAYDRIGRSPMGYLEVRMGIRRCLLQRFPYAAYFTVDDDAVVVLAVIHASRDPAEWQRRNR